MKNPQVVASSIIALVFVYLSFAIDWLFIIPAVVIMFWNQKQLFHSKKDCKNNK